MKGSSWLLFNVALLTVVEQLWRFDVVDRVQPSELTFMAIVVLACSFFVVSAIEKSNDS